MAARTLIISDTHLGRPHGSAGTAASLAPLLEGFDRVIVNGDLAEVHDPDWHLHASREVLAFQDLCEAAGAELTIISGNHDPLLSDHRHMELAGGTVLITHGDVLHEQLTPWSPNASRLRAVHKAALCALEESERDDLHARLAAAQHAAHHEWLEGGHRDSALTHVLTRPWVVFQVLHAWAVFPGLAAAFADRHAPDAKFVLIGHTHRAGIYTRRGRTIINTGAFAFPGSPRGVVLEDDTLSVWRIVSRRGLYQLAKRPLRNFTIETPTVETRKAA